MLSAFVQAIRVLALLLAAWWLWSRLFPKARKEVDRTMNVAACVLVVAAFVVFAAHFLPH
ncbi:protein MIGRI [Silvimonas amylolytica]|uniref:Uncharacterized protein n=1 Tax=Silvimonas amylolytica TaxID=449663 RepID=A0ABQ2PJ83_9NEIS|nr:hypothetical protein [Silvimonas amylolytica]GGP25663.1 hypothetical protein GCM10010971_14820 [Silvimonas amylolytica]